MSVILDTQAYRQLVEDLITEDFRQHQLLFYMENAGIVVEHTLELCPLVARFMGVPFGQISDAWMETYMRFAAQTQHYELCDTQGLKALAGRCYEALGGMG